MLPSHLINPRHDSPLSLFLSAAPVSRWPYPGSSHPSSGSYYLSNDAVYVVISGNATFGTETDDEQLVHEYGDAFWVMGGTERMATH